MLICLFILATCFQIHQFQQLEDNSQSPLVHIGLDYVADSEFKYDDTEKWKEKYPICGGKSQSPINIDPSKCERVSKKATLKVTNEDYRPESVELINDHYTVKYLISWQKNHFPTISGDILRHNRYIPRDIHFHWGHEDSQGSEHSINTRKYSMEMHIVSYNAKYKSVADAKFHRDGILVIAQLFHVNNSAPNYFFLDYLPRVKQSRRKIVIKDKLCAFNLGEFLNVDALSASFVTYNGSFTTPPCYEDVTWVLPLKINAIPHNKMRFFRDIQGLEGHLVDNYRPIQPTNGRKCYALG
ncbi:carbonic anhydrase 2-like [Phlebotomus argentipes]|uniref:carbonic anhydrase 2-like n=1 Tax=Phlebotomus argentipes TaxID=94469 RepID=UPI00289352DD|nr:carbonic anhydrase 2-like [Phlebotomus argentipes]